MPRTYELRRRAERQAETRQRIIEATVELHATLGGGRTTISDIAERAGVERATVYRHFPDEQTMFAACTGHFLAQHPPPDPAPWLEIADPAARLRRGLTEVYAYRRRTERMADRTDRDLPDLPALRAALAPTFAHWARIRDVLATGWATAPERELLVARVIGHALAFSTWRSLVREQGLDEAQAVAAMAAMVCGIAHRAEGRAPLMVDFSS
jgi:AcrR family transcriptional regulator